MVDEVLQADLRGISQDELGRNAPLPAVARFDVRTSGDLVATRQRRRQRQVLQYQEFGAGADQIGTAEIAIGRRQFGLFPLPLPVSGHAPAGRETQLQIDLSGRQQNVLDLGARYIGLGRIRRRLRATGIREEQAFAPGDDLAPGAQIHRKLADRETGVGVGIEQARTVAEPVFGGVREFLVGPGLVDGIRRVIVVAALVGIVIEDAAADEHAAAASAQVGLAEQGDAVVDQGMPIEIAIAIVAIDVGNDRLGRIVQPHRRAISKVGDGVERELVAQIGRSRESRGLPDQQRRHG